MAFGLTVPYGTSGVAADSPGNEANSSGLSWAAVIGGGFVSAALSLILLALGAGLGLSSVSPWSNVGASAATITVAAVLWLIVMQAISSAMGGYLAGRLRTKWASVHTDEVYFRDTAHGFLSWAVAFVISAAFLTSAAASMVGSSSSAGASGKVESESRAFDPNGYYIDTLFRSAGENAEANSSANRGEVERIFANGLRQGAIPSPDRSYLALLVAQKTGLNQVDADRRVSDVFGRAQAGADAIRKAVAHSMLWAFLALLVGAFCASFAATIGGRQRDHVAEV